MKRITLVFSIVALLFAKTTTAQYIMSSHPECTDQLAAQFPMDYLIGGFLATYAGSGVPAFTGAEIQLVAMKGGVTKHDYSKVLSTRVVLIYVDGAGAHTDEFIVPLVPDGFGGIKVSLSFGSITPVDGHMSIMLRAQLQPGADTAYDLIRCYGSVKGGTVTSSPVWSASTYLKNVLAIVPLSVPDKQIADLPRFSQIVGTFIVTASEELEVYQWNLQSTGECMGSIPDLINPRMVDSAGNNVTPPVFSGFHGSSVGIGGTPVHFAKGERKKVYVLSDIVSAWPGDFIRVEITGGCGTVYPFATIPSNTSFCENEGSLLGERVTYAPVTGIPGVEPAQQSVTIYPNPVSDNFTISLEGEWMAELSDVTGRVMMACSGVGSKVVERGSLAPGTYLLTVQSAHSRTTQRIVFQ